MMQQKPKLGWMAFHPSSNCQHTHIKCRLYVMSTWRAPQEKAAQCDEGCVVLFYMCACPAAVRQLWCICVVCIAHIALLHSRGMYDRACWLPQYVGRSTRSVRVMQFYVVYLYDEMQGCISMAHGTIHQQLSSLMACHTEHRLSRHLCMQLTARPIHHTGCPHACFQKLSNNL